MRKIKHIAVHCAATREGQVVTAAEVTRWHNARWPGHGMAYHYFYRLDGTEEIGRPESAIGNGVAGYNSNAIHLCYAGGLAVNGVTIRDTRTPAQKAAMAKRVADLHRRYPAAKIMGHRDFSPDLDRNGVIEPHEWIKGCPSFDVAAWLREIGLAGDTTLEQRRVTASILNVRAGPDTSHPVLGRRRKGDLVAVLGAKAGWARIDGGWVSETYLESVKEKA